MRKEETTQTLQEHPLETRGLGLMVHLTLASKSQILKKLTLVCNLSARTGIFCSFSLSSCHFPDNSFLSSLQQRCISVFRRAEPHPLRQFSLPCVSQWRDLPFSIREHPLLAKGLARKRPEKPLQGCSPNSLRVASQEACQLSSFSSTGIRSWDTNLIECNLDQELKLFVSRHSARFSPEVPGEASVSVSQEHGRVRGMTLAGETLPSRGEKQTNKQPSSHCCEVFGILFMSMTLASSHNLRK